MFYVKIWMFFLVLCAIYGLFVKKSTLSQSQKTSSFTLENQKTECSKCDGVGYWEGKIVREWCTYCGGTGVEENNI